MDNIYNELHEAEDIIKNLYSKSQEIKAGISIKYFKHQLNEYLNNMENAV